MTDSDQSNEPIKADEIKTGSGRGLFRIRLAHLPSCDYFVSGDLATRHPNWWPRCTCNLDGTLKDIETQARRELVDVVERAEKLLSRDHHHTWRPDLVQCEVEQDALGILRNALSSIRS